MQRLLAAATARLAAAGIDSPRTDAELLLAHCLGTSRAALWTRSDVPVATAARFEDLTTRRAAREPLQHLLGTAAFRHVLLAVGPGVFIPRPETELLVDAVLARLPPDPVVVDLCAGSGALAIAVADEVPGARVFAVECSPQALRWLRRNAQGAASVTVVEADVADRRLLADLTGRADAVLSNPPYVPASTEVGAEVRHDPSDAVFAGADGLALMPAVIATAARLLRPGGAFAVEHDDTHGDTVPGLLRADGRWREVTAHRDLAGRPRYATAIRA